MGEIIVKIRPDGTIEAQTKNIKGKKCLKNISILENILNAKTLRSEFTEEYYEEDVKVDLKDKIVDKNRIIQD